MNRFRALSAAVEGGADADDLLASARYWPLSLLKYAPGDECEQAVAEANWRGGRDVGPTTNNGSGVRPGDDRRTCSSGGSGNSGSEHAVSPTASR